MSGDLLGFDGPLAAKAESDDVTGNGGLASNDGHSLLDSLGRGASPDGFDLISGVAGAVGGDPSGLFGVARPPIESRAMVDGGSSNTARDTLSLVGATVSQDQGSTNLLDFGEARASSTSSAEVSAPPDLVSVQPQPDTQQPLPQRPQDVLLDVLSEPPTSSEGASGNIPTWASAAPDLLAKEMDPLAAGVGQAETNSQNRESLDPTSSSSSVPNSGSEDPFGVFAPPSEPQQDAAASGLTQFFPPVGEPLPLSGADEEAQQSSSDTFTAVANGTRASSFDVTDSTEAKFPKESGLDDHTGGPTLLQKQPPSSDVSNEVAKPPQEVSPVVNGVSGDNGIAVPPQDTSVAGPSSHQIPQSSKMIDENSSESSTPPSGEESGLAITFASKSSSSPVGNDAVAKELTTSALQNKGIAGDSPIMGDPPPSTPTHPPLAPENSEDTPLPKPEESLQKELNAAQALIEQLQHRHDDEQKRIDAVVVELQGSLQNEMNRRAEAEQEARRAKAQCVEVQEQFKSFRGETDSKLGSLKRDLELVSEEKSKMEREVKLIRDERDEQARKEMALTTRLNAAKKKEALKSNAAEHYEDQVDHLERQAVDYKGRLENMTAERDQLQVELSEWKQYAERRTKQLEAALSDEKKLNDERKRKMKGFVEAKTEEVRAAKADNISLQTELDQTAHSLKDLNQRYKQLHAQWVQSQTRNRELQRDVTKMKMDSEKMHKVGGTLEARLSRSAQESEDHKHKRIQAKHELMSVLSQLEAERSVNNRLRESIKMTFTPKALSQQQTIQETMDDFEGALQKMATRLGRPVPPPPSSANDFAMAALNEDDGAYGTSSNGALDDDDEGRSSGNTLSDINTNRVLQKLENETKRVSQSIVSLSTGVERMHAMLEGGGTRNCVGALQSILMSSRPSEETRSITGNSTIASTRNGPRYGHISGSMT